MCSSCSEQLSDQVEVEISEDSDVDPDGAFLAYSISQADPMCFKLDQMIRKGTIDKNGILYKLLDNTIEISVNRFHKYDIEVIEFFKTLEYLGGNRTASFVRGPMRVGMKKNEASTNILV